MKSLKTYIEQIDDPIRQQMLNYLAIEIELNRNVFENFDLSNKCMYDGQYDLAMFVCKKAMEKETPYLCFYKNELSAFKNIFFEKLEIMFDSSKDHYDSKVKYDEDTKKFKELKIFLNIKEHSYFNLKQNMKTVVHELDHAYKDWESYVNNEEFHLYDFSKPGTRYYNSTKWTNDFKDDYAKKLVYHLEEIEQSAYLSEIYNDVKDLKFKDYKQLVDLAEQHSEAYQLYNMLLVSFSELVKNAPVILRDSSQSVYVYGSTLEQSCAAAQKLSDMGYSGVAEIGSYADWQKDMSTTETESLMGATIE